MPRPVVHVTLVCSESSTDVSTAARVLKEVFMLRGATSAHPRPVITLTSETEELPVKPPPSSSGGKTRGHSAPPNPEVSNLSRHVSRYVAELEKARAVRDGTVNLDEELKVAEEALQTAENGGSPGLSDQLEVQSNPSTTTGRTKRRPSTGNNKGRPPSNSATRSQRDQQEALESAVRGDRRRRYCNSHLPNCELLYVPVKDLEKMGLEGSLSGGFAATNPELNNSSRDDDTERVPLLMVYALDHEDTFLQSDDTSSVDWESVFWRTVEPVLPANVPEITAVWALADPSQLRAFMWSSQTASSAPTEKTRGGKDDNGKASRSSSANAPKGGAGAGQKGRPSQLKTVAPAVTEAPPPDSPVASSTNAAKPRQRLLRPSMLMYLNDASFTDRTVLPADQDNSAAFMGCIKALGGDAPTSSRGGTSDAKNARGRVGARGGKGGGKGAKPGTADGSMPMMAGNYDLNQVQFYDASVDVDEILYVCNSFAEFVAKEQRFSAQKQFLLDQRAVVYSTTTYNNAPHRQLVHQVDAADPDAPLTARVSSPMRVAPKVPRWLADAAPLEVLLAEQNRPVPSLTQFAATLLEHLTAVPPPSTHRASVAASESGGKKGAPVNEPADDGSGENQIPTLKPTRTPLPVRSEPTMKILRMQVKTIDDEKWLAYCMRKVRPLLTEMSTVTDAYSKWRAVRHTVEVPMRVQNAIRAVEVEEELAKVEALKSAEAAAIAERDSMSAPLEAATYVHGIPSAALRREAAPSILSDDLDPLLEPRDTAMRMDQTLTAERPRHFIESEPITNLGPVYHRDKLLGGAFTCLSAMQSLVSQTTSNMARHLPLRLVKPAKQLVPIASLGCADPGKILAQTQTLGGQQQQPEPKSARRATAAAASPLATIVEPLPGTEDAPVIRILENQEEEQFANEEEVKPFFRAYSTALATSRGDNHGTLSVVAADRRAARNERKKEDTERKAQQRQRSQSKKSENEKSGSNPRSRSSSKNTAASPPPPEEEKEEDVVARMAEKISKKMRFENVCYTAPNDHELDRARPPIHPQEVEWLVEQYIQKGLGNFAYSTRRRKERSGHNPTCSTVKKKDVSCGDFAVSVAAMRELQGEQLGGCPLSEAESAEENRLAKIIRDVLRNASVDLLQDSAPTPHSTKTNTDEASTTAPSTGGLRNLTVAAELLKSVIQGPFTLGDEELLRTVERSLTLREREHVIQHSLLHMLARHGQLIPRGFGGSDAAEDYNVGERIALTTAYKRMFDYCLRFGLHHTSLMGLSGINTKMIYLADEPKTILSDNNARTGGVSAQTTLFSRDAENVYPPRRAEQIWVAGVRTPAERRRRLLWVHVQQGIHSREEYTRWQQWLQQSSEERHPTAKAEEAAYQQLLRDVVARQLEQTHFCVAAPSTPSTTESSKACTDGKPLATSSPTVVWPSSRSEDVPRFWPESRQSIFPHAQAIIEVVTSLTSRSCHYIDHQELMATLHYTLPNPDVLPPPSQKSKKRFSFSMPPNAQTPGESKHLCVRFDDGVTLTCVRQAPELDKSSPTGRKGTLRTGFGAWLTEGESANANKEGDVDEAANSSFVGSLHSVGSRGSVRDRSAAASSSKGKGRRGAPKVVTVPIEETRSKVLQSLISTLQATVENPGAPLSNQGDVRAWLRVDDTPDKTTTTAKAATEGRKREASISAKWRHSPDASKDQQALSVNTSCADEEKYTCMGVPSRPAAFACEERHTVDVHITSNVFTFVARESEKHLWMHYTASPTSEASRDASLEAISCIMEDLGGKSTMQPSMEVETHRSVCQVSGVVTRYFLSGTEQILFPSGSVVTRFRTHIFKATVTPAADTLASTAVEEHPMDDKTADATISTSAAMLESPDANDEAQQHFVETLILPTGNLYVRTVTRVDDHWAEESRYTMVEEPFERHVTYDAGTCCCVVARGDGVTTAYYYDSAATAANFRSTAQFSDSAASREGMYCRVAVHQDGTTLTTMYPNHTVQRPAPAIVPLMNEVDAVLNACAVPTREANDVVWCIDSARMPRLFLAPFLLDNDDAANANATITASWMDSARRPKCSSSYYALFGDGTSLRRYGVKRIVRNHAAWFLETAFTRPTRTTVRIVHNSSLVMLEPAHAMERNDIEARPHALAVAEGFPVFDLALGGLRMVDQQQHVATVQNLFSVTEDVAVSLRPSTWELLLRELVNETYSPHRLPKAAQAALVERQRLVDEEERQIKKKAGAAYVPSLTLRLRELAEAFIIQGELLKPELLRTLVKEVQLKSGTLTATLRTISEVPAGRTGRVPPFMNTAITMGGTDISRRQRGQHDAAAPPAADNGIMPLYFSQLANGEVWHLMRESEIIEVFRNAKAENIAAEVSMNTGIPAGESGVQQLSVLRVTPEGKAHIPAEGGAQKSGRRSVGSDSADLLGNAKRQQQLLARFHCGTTAAALSVRAVMTVGMTTSALGGGTRWLPAIVQPPKRFISPPAMAPRDDQTGQCEADTSAEATGIQSELLRVFLSVENTPAALRNLIIAGEIYRQEAVHKLGKYHQTMLEHLPEVPEEAVAQQKRLQEVYYKLRREKKAAAMAAKQPPTAATSVAE